MKRFVRPTKKSSVHKDQLIYSMKTLQHKSNFSWGIFFITLFLFLFPLSAASQTDSITISKSPRFPEPYQSVTVSLTSRLTNLNDKEIVWRQDGEVIKAEVGGDEVTIDVGAAGETTTVTMQTNAGGGVVEKTMDITPTDVDLIWEAENSYTPPFYKGKALHSGWGDVRVTAIPHIYDEDGELINRNNLVYKWEYNGLVYGNDSGRGENSFSVKAVPRNNNLVSVRVEKPSGDLVAYKSVTLPLASAELVLYRHDPLLGTDLSKALGDEYKLDEGNEITIKAVPYFYLQNTPASPDLEYDWEMNGDSITPAEFKDVVTFRRPEGVGGRANVTLEIDDTSRLFPSVDTRLEIIF